MRARTRVEVGAHGVLRTVRCEPPLTVRRLRAADAEVCALCLVGTAAGPLPGDDLGLDLCVGAGARVVVSAAGASIAQGGHGVAARLFFHADVGAGASLIADPGALVVAAGADVVVDVSVSLAADAELTWCETVVLGRHGEAPGRVVLRWNVRRAGRPLLRQDVDLAEPSLRAWSGMLAGAKVLTTTLRVGPSVDARTEVRTPTDVTQLLAEQATLTTTLTA